MSLVLDNPNVWVDEFGDYLYRYALMRVKSETIAQDLVQETFFAAFKARERFAGNSSEKTWFVAILKHKILDYFRKNKREITESEMSGHGESDPLNYLFDEKGMWKTGPSNWEVQADRVLENKELNVQIHDCIDKLPDKFRTIYALKELDDVDSDTICKEMEISPTNLWVRLHRARGILRKCLESIWAEKQRT